MRGNVTTKTLMERRSALMSKRNHKPLTLNEAKLLKAVTDELDRRHAR